jgi:putative membrane protein
MRIRGFMIATLALTFAVPMIHAQVTDQDKTFLKNSAEGNHDEIDLGHLALEKSKNEDVRMFAKKMIHDHFQLLENMKPFAMRWHVTVPDHKDADGDAKYAELKLLTGDEFDKHYITSMVADHQEDLKKFQDEIAATHDPAYKAALIKASKVIEGHLTIIQGIANKYHLS